MRGRRRAPQQELDLQGVDVVGGELLDGGGRDVHKDVAVAVSRDGVDARDEVAVDPVQFQQGAFVGRGGLEG